MGVKEPGPDFPQCELPGFRLIDDPNMLDDLLAAYIRRAREIEDADRGTSEEER